MRAPIDLPETEVVGGGASLAREALRLPEFRALWIGQAVSQLGDGLTALAALTLVNRLTGSTSAVATLAIVITAPQLLLGLHAGVFVDRWDRKRVMITSDLLRGLLILGLVFVRDRGHLGWFYAIALAQSAVGVFFEPAQAAVLPSTVPARLLLAANGLTQTTRLVAGIAGSAFAGFLLTTRGGPALAFTVDAATFVISALFVARIRPKPSALPARGSRLGADLKEGLAYLFTRRSLVGIVLAFGISLLGVGAFNVLLVPFFMDVLRVDSFGVGILRGAEIAGMLAGGAVVSIFAARLRPTTLITVGLMVLALSVAALAGVARPWLAILPLFIGGFSAEALQAGATTLLQQTVPDALRGRVESALITILTASLMISMAGAGILGDSIGIRRVFLLSGVLTLVGGAVAHAILHEATDHRHEM